MHVCTYICWTAAQMWSHIHTHPCSVAASEYDSEEWIAKGCGLTPLAVCVTVSHGKRCSPGGLWPEGDVMGQDVFPVVRFNHACGHAQRPVEEILSTPWPLHFVGVRSHVTQLATHARMRPNTWFCTTKQYAL